MADISQIKQTFDRFEEALAKNDFIEACELFKNIDTSIKAIEDFASLSSQEITWLNTLNREISAKLPQLAQQSKELITQIKPFNDKKSIKTVYSGKKI